MREIICEKPNIDILSLESMEEKLQDEHFLTLVTRQLIERDYSNIVIWGTYNNAIRLKDFLVGQGVTGIKANVINRFYQNKGVNDTCKSADFPQYALEDWLEEHAKTTIIVDFSFYSRHLLENYEEKVEDVFVGDLMGVFILDIPYVITKRQFWQNAEAIGYLYEHLSDGQSKEEFLTYLLQKNIGFYDKFYHKGPQYFDQEIVDASRCGVLVDCGAFVGDTIADFDAFTAGEYTHIYSFEMDDENFSKLSIAHGKKEKVTCIHKGVGEATCMLSASLGKNSASRISMEGNNRVEIVSLDDVLYDTTSVSMIKMDIEGFEMEALRGARKLIERDAPILAICLYHKFEDLIDIPKAILNLNSNYALYFRNYHNSASECVLYAVQNSAVQK